jgi:NADH:ubiquinone oxidoreductase subunit 6 (subunit J)
MTFAAIVFYVFAALTIVSGVFILFTKNVLYAGFALLSTFLGVAVLYIFAGADFLAIAQIMIYVGGVLVLILFGIMLTNRIAGQSYIVSENRNLVAGIVGGGGLLVILIAGIIKAKFTDLSWIQSAVRNEKVKITTLGKIGENLMTDFVLPFEVAGLILMVALMGAAFIASQVVKK